MQVAQINDTVYFYFNFNTPTAPKTGVGSLSDITVDIYRGATLVSNDVTGVVELGSGLYRFAYASTSVPEIYTAVANTEDITVEFKKVPSFIQVGQNWIENIDEIKNKTDLINQGTTVTIISPIADNQGITITRGDDYLFIDDRQLVFTLIDAPDITTATITFRVRKSDGTVFTKEAEVVGTNEFYIELTSAETLEIGGGNKRYDIEGVFGASVYTLIQGDITINADIR